jgi:lipopolysaccharide export system permease protein
VDKYIEKFDSLGNVRKKEMTFQQIIERILDPSLGEAQRQNLIRYLSEQTALAFMPLVFALISAPLGIIPHKARRMYGFAVCGGLLLAYYSLLILGETLAKKGVLNPPLAMWIPNFFLGAIGFFYMIQAEKK